MTILSVAPNNKKRVFVVQTSGATYEFPYALADPPPTVGDRLRKVYVDDELDREGFTYILESGREGSIHIDSVLEYNADPAFMADLALYTLTVRVRALVVESPLGRREIIRRLGTSASQFYRLLDPTNYRKSMKQMLALLGVLGFEVDFEIRKTAPRASA